MVNKVSPEIERIVRDIEARIINARVEMVVAVDPTNGNILHEGKGDAKSVPVGRLTNVIYTHNHPSGGSYTPYLSDDDVYAAVTRNALQIRAISRYGLRGSPYLSMMTRSPGHASWPVILGTLTDPVINVLYRAYIARYGLEQTWKKILPLAGASHPDHIVYFGGYISFR